MTSVTDENCMQVTDAFCEQASMEEFTDETCVQAHGRDLRAGLSDVVHWRDFHEGTPTRRLACGLPVATVTDEHDRQVAGSVDARQTWAGFGGRAGFDGEFRGRDFTSETYTRWQDSRYVGGAKVRCG